MTKNLVEDVVDSYFILTMVTSKSYLSFIFLSYLKWVFSISWCRQMYW